MKVYFKSIFFITALSFLLPLIIFLLIGSSSPVLASFLVAFLIFDISFFYFFVKSKRKRNPLI
ncbi:hypothetical protein J2S16_003264 [Cytobacillus kochii]|nr:hypothetical protein [Cytobacillus kochii]